MDGPGYARSSNKVSRSRRLSGESTNSAKVMNAPVLLDGLANGPFEPAPFNPVVQNAPPPTVNPRAAARGAPSYGNSPRNSPDLTSDDGPIDIGQPRFRTPFSAVSEPHTPIEQQMPAPGHQPYENMPRFGSVSSIATTDDDDAAAELMYPWTAQQDSLVRSSYEEYVNRPQTTPFSGRYPPSGVLHRVAKDTLKLARRRQIAFPHSMNAVRHRVLALYNQGPESAEELEQYKVAQDYFSLAPQCQMAHHHAFQVPPQQPAFSHEFHSANYPSSQSYPHNNDEEFEFSDAMSSSRRMSVDEKYAGHTRTGPTSFNPSTPGLASGFAPGLAAPFREPPRISAPSVNTNIPPSAFTSSPQTGGPPLLTEEDVVNIVAKRKRDSLRMKRGQY